MKSSGGRQDGNFCEYCVSGKRPPLAKNILLIDSKSRICSQKRIDFVLDHANVSTEVFRRQANLDESLLFHEDIVRNVIYDVLTEDRSRQMLVNEEIRNVGY